MTISKDVSDVLSKLRFTVVFEAAREVAEDRLEGTALELSDEARENLLNAGAAELFWKVRGLLL